MIQSDSHEENIYICIYIYKVLKSTQRFFLWAMHFAKRTSKTE